MYVELVKYKLIEMINDSKSTYAESGNGKTPDTRHDWSLEEVTELFEAPLHDLLHRAHTIHRRVFDPNELQLCTLINIKSGNCPEDCAYCSQSVHYKGKTDTETYPLLDKEKVRAAAVKAKKEGATRFCMGAAWRGPKGKNFDRVLDMIQLVKDEGLETCATLGLLDAEQAGQLKEAGLDYYNHNIDTSPSYYSKIITTRKFSDRLQTLEYVRQAGLKVCCGGIIGMGESREDRSAMLQVLATLPDHPESVPINHLIPMKGTPLAEIPPLDSLEIVRTISVARILMPASYLRLAAGREGMSDECQTLCFHAGANSIFLGERLLCADNPPVREDRGLMHRLGMRPE